MLMVQFKPNFRHYMLTLAIIQKCQKWIMTESESANCNFQISCEHASDGVSTWGKFDGHIYYKCPVIMQSISPL